MRRRRETQLIELSLSHPSELFGLGGGGSWWEAHSFESGVEHCLSVLHSRRSRAPVRLEVTLPASEVGPDTGERLVGTLRRYCSQRLAANHREARATRFHGLEALLPGIPLVAVGLLIVFVAARLAAKNGNPNLVLETIGGVLAWVGLWFPLDTLIFSPLTHRRENRLLELLQDARVVVRVRPPGSRP